MAAPSFTAAWPWLSAAWMAPWAWPVVRMRPAAAWAALADESFTACRLVFIRGMVSAEK